MQKETVDNQEAHRDVVEEKRNVATKKWRHFNGGYCKYKGRCKFVHPRELCEEYLSNMKCEVNDCPHRHPKICKWVKHLYKKNRVVFFTLHTYFV